MKKGNLLLLIIAILIVSILIVFGLIIIKNINKPETPLITENNIDNQIKEVKDRDEYYTVKNCVNKFYKYYATMFDSKENSDITKTYNLLDEKYIVFKGITQENMITVLPRKGDVVLNIDNMWTSKQTENISAYIVDGLMREELTKEISNFQIMVLIDSQNETFSVLLQDYITEKYKNINLGNNLKIESIKNLEMNMSNLYVAEEITDATYAIDLFNDYKEEVLYYQELAYQRLDEEYKNQKFGTLGKFKEYAESNREETGTRQIKQYQKKEKADYVQYTCVDQDGRYYIFKEHDIMKYSLILDTYTIDLPDFLENYNAANTVEKVGYNIQKCLDAINYKDYEYVYNKLDFEFKAINYPTLQNFEAELKNKLFDQNEVKKVSGANEGSTYIYKLTITDTKDNNKEQDMTIIMKLKEGTDFVMSLSFQ